MSKSLQKDRIIEVASLRGVSPEVKTWADVKEIIDDEFGSEAYSLRHIRRIWKAYQEDTYKHETVRDIQIEKYQMQDVMREYRKDLRDYARFDALKQVLDMRLSEFKPIPHVVKPLPKGDSGMVVVVSDWHIGAKHDNFLGEYNFDIAVERVHRYANEVVRLHKLYKSDEILILNLNDLIEGNIHVSTRVQAEFDAIDQTIKAAELLSQFIAHIANETGAKIKVGKVLDNHSRINKNHREHIEKESFGRLIDYISRIRVQHPNVKWIGNPIDENIGLTQFKGLQIGWVHGHLDTQKSVRENVSKILGLQLDIAFIAHRHHIHVTEGTIQVGSLKGTDEYAFNKRLTEGASQTITIIEDGVWSVHNVVF